ncbi:MAG TPA: hypothetical protein VN969_33965 [Streptosporangiaceae bacterium]|nr:hypothetical protein [Streptosporangiaceae bacterium]
MVSRRRVPRGWSYPLKPGEIAGALPGVGWVYWYGRPKGWQVAVVRPVFRFLWSPRSMMPQPVLIVWPVPSGDRAAVRGWFSTAAMASMRAWLHAAEAAPPTWRDAEHSAGWDWREDAGSGAEKGT